MKKIINCKTCGEEIAAKAKVCPKCGAKNRRPFFKRWWVWICIILLVAAVTSPTTGSTNTPASNLPAITPSSTTKDSALPPDDNNFSEEKSEPEAMLDSESNNSYMLDLSTTGELDTDKLELEFGKLISVIHGYDGVVVVKAKISPSYNNEATIHQNYYNVCDLIKNHGFDICSELQYWAVADMTSSNESKVISFTVDSGLIVNVKDGSVTATELGDCIDDLWILPSLLK